MSHEQVDQELLSAVQEVDQTHLLADWDNLSAAQRAELHSDLQVYTCVKHMHNDKKLICTMRLSSFNSAGD